MLLHQLRHSAKADAQLTALSRTPVDDTAPVHPAQYSSHNYIVLTGPSARSTASATLANKRARRQIQSIQDEIQSPRDVHPDIDGAVCQTLHNSILDREQ